MSAVGPLVVRAGRWMLPDGSRGVLHDSAAMQAALLGADVALVLDDSPLYPVGHVPGATVTVIGRDGDDAEPWRYRVEIPGAAPVTVVAVNAPGGDKAGPFTGLSGSELVAVLRALHRLLGVPWSHSVGRTAEHLVLATHPKQRGGRKLDREPQVPEPARPARVEQPWAAWQRPLDDAERAAGWVHVFDGNAAYLGAWQSTDLGFGVPEHFAARGCSTRTRAPGVWRVELPAGWHDGDGLPPIAPGLAATDAGTRAGWIMTPTLSRLNEHAREHGLPEVEPDEGWVWPQRSRFLRGAGERLRDARAEALAIVADARAELVTADDDARAVELLDRIAVAGTVGEAVKDLYRVMVGRLSSRDAAIAPGWRRPDWANTLRAAYRTSLHRKLAALPVAPFAVMTDAIAFATDEPDAIAFAASIGLRVGTALGTVKHAGTAPLGVVDELLGHGPRALRDAFDRAATWQHEVGTLGSRA